MNNDEYQQLVRGSEVFGKLDEQLQKTILKAEGAERDQFVKVFLTERHGIASAQAELAQKNEHVVNGLERDMEKEKRSFLKSVEQREQTAQEREAEALLDDMDDASAQ